VKPELPYCLLPSLAPYLVAYRFAREAERLEASLIDGGLDGFAIDVCLDNHRDRFWAECCLVMPSMAYH
jgi:hypothetical protein